MRIKAVGLVLILITCIFFALSTSADNEWLLEDFDRENASFTWSVGNSVAAVYPASDDNDAENSYLKISGAAAEAHNVKTVFASPSSVLDLSDYKYAKMQVKIDDTDIGNSYCYVRVILTTAEGERTESISTVTAGAWQEISIDLTPLKDRSDITRMEIGVVPDQIDSDIWYGGYAVDSITAYGYVDPVLSKRFSFNSCTSKGGVVEFSEDSTYFELTANDSADSISLEFEAEGTIKAYTNALRISLENNSDCTDFTVFMYDRNGNTLKSIYNTLSAAKESEVLYLEMPNPDKIQKIKFEFPEYDGSIRVNAIEFTDIYDPYEYIAYGKINSCTYDATENSIDISGEIPKSYVSEFEGCNLYLYALESNENAKSYAYSKADAVSVCPISTEFSFEIDVSNLGKSYLTKKFVVIIDTTPRIFAANPFYVTYSPSDFDTNGLSYGISAYDSYAVGDSGAGATVIDIHLDRLISLEKGGEPYFYENKYYYFNSAYIDRLEKQVKNLSDSGLSVSLRLLVKSADHEYLVYTPESDSYESLLANISNADGYYYFKAAVSFIAAKCNVTKNGRFGVDSLIIGKSVNSGNTVSFAPTMSMTDLVKTYADLMRVAYLAANNPNLTIYASVGDVMEHSALGYTDNRYDSLAFLTALRDFIEVEGSFPWGVCVETSTAAQTAGTNKVFSLEDNEFSAPLLESDIINTQWGKRSVILIDTLTDNSANPLTYAEKIMEKLMGNGVREFDGKYIIDSRNCGYEYQEAILEYMKAFLTGDTGKLSEIDIKISNYNSFKYSCPSAFRERSVSSADIALPDNFTGSYTYFDFNQNYQLVSWSRSYNADSIKLSVASDGTAALSAVLKKNTFETSSESPMGISYCKSTPLSFAYTPFLSLDITLENLSDTSLAEHADLTVRFIGENIIHDVKATVAIGEKQTIYVDLSEVPERTFDAVQIFVYSESSESFVLTADDIIGYSKKYDDASLKKLVAESTSKSNGTENRLNPTVIAAFAAAITVLSTLTVILQLRKKSQNKHS